jgi:hypothetical protein
VTWVADPANATDARYRIFDGATQIGTVTFDQTIAPTTALVNGAMWQGLFVYTPVTAGFHVIRVQVDDSGDGNVIADALFDPPTGGSSAANAGERQGAVAPPAPRTTAALASLDAVFSTPERMPFASAPQSFAATAWVPIASIRESHLGPAARLRDDASERSDAHKALDQPVATLALLEERPRLADPLSPPHKSTPGARFDRSVLAGEDQDNSLSSAVSLLEQEPPKA